MTAISLAFVCKKCGSLNEFDVDGSDIDLGVVEIRDRAECYECDCPHIVSATLFIDATIDVDFENDEDRPPPIDINQLTLFGGGK